MSIRQAYVHLTLAVDLPEDDAEADAAFDDTLAAIVASVSKAPRVYDESVALDDADTMPA